MFLTFKKIQIKVNNPLSKGLCVEIAKKVICQIFFPLLIGRVYIWPTFDSPDKNYILYITLNKFGIIKWKFIFLDQCFSTFFNLFVCVF